MWDSIWPEGNGSKEPLPAPNVIVPSSEMLLHEPTLEAIRGILVNPIYTGIGPFPRLVEDQVWADACAKLIEQEGARQFLVNLLYVLRECFPSGAYE